MLYLDKCSNMKDERVLIAAYLRRERAEGAVLNTELIAAKLKVSA
jgi:hypothetical protein